jgi:hypothetical protein
MFIMLNKEQIKLLNLNIKTIFIPMLSIKDCLMNETPNLNTNMIDEITSFIEKHNLKWFPGENNKGVYFLLNELCEVSPNIQPKKLIHAWNKFRKSRSFSCEPVAPQIIKLIGGDVRKLAALNPELNLSANVSNINICNWTLVYRWFINSEFSDVTQKITNPQSYQRLNVLFRLFNLGNFTNFPFHIFYQVVDHITDSSITIKRFDLVRCFAMSQKVYIYQLIPSCLTSREIFETLANKACLELARYHFPGRQIYFFFVAESISPDATRALRMLTEPVGFISIQQLAQDLEAEVFATIPEDDKSSICYFNQIFSELSVC